MNVIEARTRLEEAVQAMRYIDGMEFGQWRRTFPNVYDRVSSGPLSISCSDQPIVRLVANLQIELELRTAELILAIEDAKE